MVEIGVQTFTYSEFSIDEVARELAGRWITAVELYHDHLGPENGPEAASALSDEFAELGIDVVGYGVVGFDDPQEVREQLEFVDAVGGDYVSVDVDPGDDETLHELISEAEELDLDIAIHNHGPGHEYSTAEDVQTVLDAHPDIDRLGACVDTGHFLRSGQSMDDVFSRLGGRINALHLKDFTAADREVIPGEGLLDLSELVSLIEESGCDRPLMIEYDDEPDDPTPNLKTTIRKLRRSQ